MFTQAHISTTPKHPRLLELAASSHPFDSPFSTPDSAVTASSVDKTGDTPAMHSEGDTRIDEDTSGESLGIRGRRSGPSGFLDAGESPQTGTHSESSESPQTASNSALHFPDDSASPARQAEASPDPAACHPVRPTELAADQPDVQENQEASHTSVVSSTTFDRARAKVKEAHLVPAVKYHSAIGAGSFYSPPPPPSGALSLKRGAGDYYPDAIHIPSPKLDSIPEVSGEISRHRIAMAETPLRANNSLRLSALAGRRAT